ncbi:MAG: acetyl-CoA synthetase, partial [Pseudonocardiales bacterium]|nr:acetyl-CoA synthetase [Pseudonocardiales bacterium]
MAESGPTLSNLSNESRSFAPSEQFAAQANGGPDLYVDAERDRDAFWATQADRLSWGRRWDKVLEWEPP